MKRHPEALAAVLDSVIPQSMNVIFGRSANAGLLEENKRQTAVLNEIADVLAPAGEKTPTKPTNE